MFNKGRSVSELANVPFVDVCFVLHSTRFIELVRQASFHIMEVVPGKISIVALKNIQWLNTEHLGSFWCFIVLTLITYFFPIYYTVLFLFKLIAFF